MKMRMIVMFVISTIMIISGCSNSITDTATEKRLEIIQNPDSSLTKVKVETDGMLAELGYDHPHPFGLNNEVLVDSNYYEGNKVSRGDITVFKIKNDEKAADIARIVGLPGETVQVKKGQVFINGNKLDTFYGDDSTSDNNDSMDKPVKLKENEYFILADVRWRGFNDSQTAGAFVDEEIIGKVVGYENKIEVVNEVRKVTKEQLRLITEDMTFKEVINIWGDTKDFGSGRYIKSYEYENGENIIFNFGSYDDILDEQSYITIQSLLGNE
jgi:signal peptidase I